MRYRPLALICSLGIICLLCASCGQDELKALRKKARRGDVDAQMGLGAAYFEGEGVPQDYTEAAKWLRMAAEQGNSTAQISMGIICLSGDCGVLKNEQEAARWFELSAKQGNDLGRYYLGVIYLTGIGVSKDERKGFSYWGKIEDPEVKSLVANAIRAMGSSLAQKSSRQQQTQHYQQQQLQTREDRRFRDLQRSVLEGQYRELYPNATPHLGW